MKSGASSSTQVGPGDEKPETLRLDLEGATCLTACRALTFFSPENSPVASSNESAASMQPAAVRSCECRSVAFVPPASCRIISVGAQHAVPGKRTWRDAAHRPRPPANLSNSNVAPRYLACQHPLESFIRENVHYFGAPPTCRGPGQSNCFRSCWADPCISLRIT